MIILNEDSKQNIITITFNKIDKIDLPALDEVKNLPKNLLTYEYNEKYCNLRVDAYRWWWTKTKAAGDLIRAVRACKQFALSVNNYFGELGIMGTESEFVRPVLRIKNFDFSNINIGDEVLCLGYNWYYIGHDSILSKYPVGVEKFNEVMFLNDYETSDIKIWLEDWLNNTLYDELNFYVEFEDESAYCLDKKEVINYIKEKVNDGYSGKIVIINNRTSIKKELYTG